MSTQMYSSGVTIGNDARILARDAMLHGAFQKELEFAMLLDLLMRRRPRSVLEIGSARGGALYAFARCAAPDAVICSIDWADELEEPCVSAEVLKSYCQPGQRTAMLRANSQLDETRDLAKDACPDGYDFLFIDGDHRLESVARDHELYAPLVRPGGLVGLHDVMEPSVRKIDNQRPTEVDLFWGPLEKPGEVWEFSDYSDTTFGGIGVYQR